MKKSVKLVISLGLLVLICLGGWFGFRWWSQSNRTENIDITAVGDSLTQGVGDPNNRGGYVYMITKKLQDQLPTSKVTASNFGIAGETSVQIDYRVDHSHKLQKNIQRSNVIVMTFGGNDLIHFIKRNLMMEQKSTLDLQLATFERDYAKNANKLLADVRKQNPDAQVYVFGIYNPVYVYLPQVKFISQAINQTNKLTKSTVKNHKNMYFVPISNELSDGKYQTQEQHKKLIRDAQKQPSLQHGLSANSIIELFGSNNDDKNNLISNDDHFHPNQKGYQVMTQQLYKSMKTHLPVLRSSDEKK